MIFLFAASLLLRLVFMLTLKPHFYFDDETEYFNVVRNFLSGNGLIVSESLKAYRPPLYPLFLSVLYGLKFNVAGIRFVQVILSSATTVFIFLTGRRVFSEKVGWYAGLVSVGYPFFIFYTGFLLTETLFIFLTVLALGEFTKLNGAERYLLPALSTGFFFGLAGLCRPTLELFLPFALLFLLMQGKNYLKRGIKEAFWVLAAFSLTLSPWVARNYALFGKFMPGTSMGGQVFWEGNNPCSEGGPCRYFTPGIWQVPEKDRDAAFYRETFAVLKENPRRFLWLLGNKFLRFWNVVPNAADFTKPAYRAVSVLSFGIMMPFFVLGFLAAVRNRNARIFHVLIVFFTLFHMIFLASIRYRIPIEPYYIMFAVFGFLWLRDRLAAVCPQRGVTPA